MSYECIAVEVMIASPSDVAACRETVREVLHDWNNVFSRKRKVVLLPVGWDTHTAAELGKPPQEIINERVLSDCDLLIGVFWSRVGTATTGHVSGSVEEIQKHVNLKKPAMIYFSTEDIPQSQIDAKQLDTLGEFKEWCKTRGIIQTFENQADFRLKLTRELAIILDTNPYLENAISGALAPRIAGKPGAVRKADPIADICNSLSKEARELLLEASKDKEGVINRISLPNRYFLRTHGVFFGDSEDNRSKAIWEDAFRQLLNAHLLTPDEPSGRVFRLTKSAYDVVDRLGAKGDS